MSERRSASVATIALSPPAAARVNRQPVLVGHRDVGEAGDVDVEDGAALLLLGGERADHAEGGEVDALDLQAGALGGADETVDQLAAGGDDDHAHARAADALHQPERDVVEDRLVHRHRDVIGSLGAHGGVELLRVLERREVERAHDDALVRHAQADVLGQVVLGEEGLQRLGRAPARR